MALLENMSNTKMMTTMTTAITSMPYKQTNIRMERMALLENNISDNNVKHENDDNNDNSNINNDNSNNNNGLQADRMSGPSGKPAKQIKQVNHKYSGNNDNSNNNNDNSNDINDNNHNNIIMIKYTVLSENNVRNNDGSKISGKQGKR